MNYNVGTTIIGKDVYINGEKLPSPPIKSNYINVTTINGQVLSMGLNGKMISGRERQKPYGICGFK